MSRNHHNRPVTTDQIETSRQPEGRKGGKAAGAALGLLAVAGAGTAIYALNEQSQQIRHEVRLEAQQDIDGFKNEVIVLNEGVTLRTTPHGGTGNNPETSNIIKQTDKNLVIRGVALSEDHDGWASFVMEGDTDGITNLDERSDKAVWVNLTELDKQGYVSAYDIAPLDGLDRGTTTQASVTQTGTLTVDGFDGQNLGVANYYSDEQLQMLDFVVNGN